MGSMPLPAELILQGTGVLLQQMGSSQQICVLAFARQVLQTTAPASRNCVAQRQMPALNGAWLLDKVSQHQVMLWMLSRHVLFATSPVTPMMS